MGARMHFKVGDTWGNRGLVFPDLRHSAATILISMGINPKIIQELLGHSDISITLGIYGHLFPSMQQGIADKWQEVFGVEEEEEDGDDEEEEDD